MTKSGSIHREKSSGISLFHVLMLTILNLGIFYLIFGCTAGNTLKIGLLAPFSGPTAGFGEKARNGVLLAIDEVNSTGGIKGKEIELIIRDDQATAEAAREGARDLSEERVQAVVGPYSSTAGQAAMEILSEENILVFSPTIMSQRFREKDDNLLLLNHPARFSGELQAERIIDRYKLYRGALIWDKGNFSYSSEWIEGFKERFLESEGIITDEISAEFTEEIALIPITEQVFASNPDFVVIVTNDFYAALLVQLLRKEYPEFPVFLSEWGTNRELINIGGPSVEGIEVLRKYNIEDNSPDFVHFKEEYNKRFGTLPDSLAFLSYETARIVISGLKEKSWKVSVKDAIIRKGLYHGLQWDITIDRFGDCYTDIQWYVISGGRFVLVP